MHHLTDFLLLFRMVFNFMAAHYTEIKGTNISIGVVLLRVSSKIQKLFGAFQ